MVAFALRPRWWAWHLLLVAVLVSFGWLGWWQLESFDRPSSGTATQRPVAAVDRVTVPGGRLAADDPGRRVRATGTWEADRQLLVPERELDGRAGALVVTPLRTDAGVLPVVRGWLPAGAAQPDPLTGPVVVTGVVHASETEADAVVGPAATRAGEVAYVATVALLERLPYEASELYDGYVVLRAQDPADPAGLERLEPLRHDDPAGGVGRWRNLAYGLQWWLFGAAAIFFWGSVIRRAALERGPDPEPGAAREPLAAPRRTT